MADRRPMQVIVEVRSGRIENRGGSDGCAKVAARPAARRAVVAAARKSI